MRKAALQIGGVDYQEKAQQHHAATKGVLTGTWADFSRRAHRHKNKPPYSPLYIASHLATPSEMRFSIPKMLHTERVSASQV